MAKKIKKEIKEFNAKVESLVGQGYVAISPNVALMATGKPRMDTFSVGNETFTSSRPDALGGGRMQGKLAFFDGKQSNPKPTPAGVGSKDKGYIPWGPQDNLPNQIFQYSNALPYTAAAHKYITDLTVGLGPKLMYSWPRYINGSLKEELIPYEHAGVLIRGCMRDLRAKMEAATTQGQGGGGPANISASQPAAIFPKSSATPTESNTIGTINTIGTTPAIGSITALSETRTSPHTILLSEAASSPEPAAQARVGENKPLPGSYEEEMMHLEEALAEWERTMPEYLQFIEDNNVELHYQKCITDDTMMDIYFPTYGLNRGRKGSWNAKIVSIGHLPAVCTRMEQMDEEWRVNYVYFSEKWRKDTTSELEQKEMVAYPALAPDRALKQLRETVKSHERSSVSSRPLWFCAPTYYPSMLKPYYPQPAWWSIFPSEIYNYATNLLGDKATARENATAPRFMIFLNLSYLKQICDQNGWNTPEQVEEFKDDIYATVNEFLADRRNNGKSMMLESFLTNNDTELWKSVEIVEVPQAKIETDTKEALGEISRTIFFALGVHPSLIGADPGGSSTGGTFQRELQLLKQQQVSGRQRIYLKFLQNICAFNQWDRRAVWIIREQVLTTLDRNANGIEDTSSRL